MRILIVDDHALFAQGLQRLLELSQMSLEVLPPCLYGDRLLERLSEDKVDLLLLDLNLGSMSGIDLLPSIKSNYPASKVLIVSMYASYKIVRQAFMNGADGYVLKSTDLSELENAIKVLSSGEVYFGKGVKTVGYNNVAKGQPLTKFSNTFDLENVLTRRELEILGLLMQAKKSREIAQDLYISVQTVNVHRKRIMKKLAVSNAAGLIQKVNEISHS